MILSDPAGPQLIQVTLVKREGMKLGLGIANTPNGIIVTKVTETGLAHEQAPEIRTGLKFEVVNSQSCAGLDKAGMVRLLKSEGLPQVQMILSDPKAPAAVPAAPEQVIYDLASRSQPAEHAPSLPPRHARHAPDPDAFFRTMAAMSSHASRWLPGAGIVAGTEADAGNRWNAQSATIGDQSTLFNLDAHRQQLSGAVEVGADQSDLGVGLEREQRATATAGAGHIVLEPNAPPLQVFLFGNDASTGEDCEGFNV